MKRLIKSKFISGFQSNDLFYECYENPATREWEIISELDPNYGTRVMVLEDGIIYAWNGAILHSSAVRNFNIPDGLHLNFFNNKTYINLIPQITFDYFINSIKNCDLTDRFLNWKIVEIDYKTYGCNIGPNIQNFVWKTLNDIKDYKK